MKFLYSSGEGLDLLDCTCTHCLRKAFGVVVSMKYESDRPSEDADAESRTVGWRGPQSE